MVTQKLRIDLSLVVEGRLVCQKCHTIITKNPIPDFIFFHSAKSATPITKRFEKFPIKLFIDDPLESYKIVETMKISSFN